MLTLLTKIELTVNGSVTKLLVLHVIKYFHFQQNLQVNTLVM